MADEMNTHTLLISSFNSKHLESKMVLGEELFKYHLVCIVSWDVWLSHAYRSTLSPWHARTHRDARVHTRTRLCAVHPRIQEVQLTCHSKCVVLFYPISFNPRSWLIAICQAWLSDTCSVLCESVGPALFACNLEWRCYWKIQRNDIRIIVLVLPFTSLSYCHWKPNSTVNNQTHITCVYLFKNIKRNQ